MKVITVSNLKVVWGLENIYHFYWWYWNLSDDKVHTDNIDDDDDDDDDDSNADVDDDDDDDGNFEVVWRRI